MRAGDRVRVAGAPGYKDFEGELRLIWNDWPFVVVRDDDGRFHVVPTGCLKEV